MKIGVAIPVSSWPDEDDVWPVERLVEYGVRAERLGFDCLWAEDHLWIELFGSRRPTLPDPFVLRAGREDAERLLAEHPPPPMIGPDGLRTLVEEWRESGCDSAGA